MATSYDLRALPADALLASLRTLLARDHQVTADLLAHLALSAKVHDQLIEAKALLRHRIPSGDLDAVLGRALEALLRDLRRDKFGETSAPRAQTAPPREGSRHIASTVKRAVAERDGHQCTFVDA